MVNPLPPKFPFRSPPSPKGILRGSSRSAFLKSENSSGTCGFEILPHSTMPRVQEPPLQGNRHKGEMLLLPLKGEIRGTVFLKSLGGVDRRILHTHFSCPPSNFSFFPVQPVPVKVRNMKMHGYKVKAPICRRSPDRRPIPSGLRSGDGVVKSGTGRGLFPGPRFCLNSGFDRGG